MSNTDLDTLVATLLSEVESHLGDDESAHGAEDDLYRAFVYPDHTARHWLQVLFPFVRVAPKDVTHYALVDAQGRGDVSERLNNRLLLDVVDATCGEPIVRVEVWTDRKEGKFARLAPITLAPEADQHLLTVHVKVHIPHAPMAKRPEFWLSAFRTLLRLQTQFRPDEVAVCCYVVMFHSLHVRQLQKIHTNRYIRFSYACIAFAWRPKPDPFVSTNTPASGVCSTMRVSNALPSVESVRVAVMDIGVLIADGKLVRQLRKNEFSPQSKHDTAEPRPNCAESRKFNRIVPRKCFKPSTHAWPDQRRRCCHRNNLTIMHQSMTQSPLVSPMERPHLMRPFRKALVSTIQAYRVHPNMLDERLRAYHCIASFNHMIRIIHHVYEWSQNLFSTN